MVTVKLNYYASSKTYVAQITGLHPVYKLNRKFLKESSKELSSSRKTGFLYFQLEEGQVYEIAEAFKDKKLVKIQNGEEVVLTQEQVEEIFRKQETKEEVIPNTEQLNEVEKELIQVHIKTKNIDDNLYNILTKEEYNSLAQWIIAVNFKVNNVTVKDLIKNIAKSKNEKIVELEKEHEKQLNVLQNDIFAFFQNNRNIEQELKDEYKKTINNDKIFNLIF